MSILLLVAAGWMYVVSMMAIAEAISTQGSVLGAVVTFVLYGALPLSLVLYLLATPGRRRRRREREAAPHDKGLDRPADGGRDSASPADEDGA